MADGHRERRTSALTVFCTLAIVCTLVVGAAGCGSSGEDPGEATSTSSKKMPVATGSAEGCKQAEPSKAKSVSYRAPKQAVGRGQKLTAVVKTSCGTFQIALEAKRWPTTVNSFAFLAGKGFYDGLSFERAGYDTYLEGGKPPGANGPGYRIKGEAPPLSFIYRQGVVAMSQSGEAPPGTAGSRFFIVVAKPWLDFGGAYAPLGKVNKNFDVVKHISELGPPDKYPGSGNLGTTGQVGKLRTPVLIEKITIEKG
jgi:cyclophilin family peptidyl-prolyl cis-trans isomerase